MRAVQLPKCLRLSGVLGAVQSIGRIWRLLVLGIPAPEYS